jgi:hypothetical protein
MTDKEKIKVLRQRIKDLNWTNRSMFHHLSFKNMIEQLNNQAHQRELIMKKLIWVEDKINDLTSTE